MLTSRTGPYREWLDSSVMEALFAYRIHNPRDVPEDLVREAEARGFDTNNLIDVSVDVTYPGSAIVIGSHLSHRGGWQGHVGRENDGRYRADLTESDTPAVDVHRDAVGWAGPFDPDTEDDAETLGYAAAASILAKLHDVTRFRLVVTYEYPREEGSGLVKFVDLRQ